MESVVTMAMATKPNMQRAREAKDPAAVIQLGQEADFPRQGQGSCWPALGVLGRGRPAWPWPLSAAGATPFHPIPQGHLDK